MKSQANYIASLETSEILSECSEISRLDSVQFPAKFLQTTCPHKTIIYNLNAHKLNANG
jgi:hypothetical protein